MATYYSKEIEKKEHKKKIVKIKDFAVIDSAGRPDIKQYHLIQYLSQHGFFCYQYGYDDYVLYKVDENNIADVCNKVDIYNYIINEIFSKKGSSTCNYPAHREFFIRRFENILSKNKLNLLAKINANTLRDNKYESFFPFDNGIVCVTKDNIEIKRYNQVLKGNNVVLKSKIIKKQVKIISRDIAMNSDFAVFASRAVGEEGFSYLRRALGYMMHLYKDSANAKMIFFSDANNSYGVPNGRTGKSLCAKIALQQIREVATIDGKQFNQNDKFMFDNVDANTDIMCLQDMRNDFNKETLYNMITGDFQIGQKYKPKQSIPFERSPKIIADSNYGISLRGGSDLGRFIVIGFDNYYDDEHTPIDEFKREFFGSEWNEDDWNKFYSFMFYCEQDYLRYGIANYKIKDLLSNSLYSRFPRDLINQIKDNIPMFMEKHTTSDWWKYITYWNNDESTLDSTKMKTIKAIMLELGYVKDYDTYKYRVENGINSYTTSAIRHWFKLA